MDTPDYTADDIETIEAADTDHQWAGEANMRLNQAQQLLDDISEVIETIEPQRREHAADLLDTAIEALTRATRRFPSPATATSTPGEDPPF